MERDPRKDALSIFKAALKAVDARQLVLQAVKAPRHGTLEIRGNVLDLSSFENIYVLGAGKAACPMAKALEEVLGGFLTKGVVVVKYGHVLPLSSIAVREAGHPEPDANGVASAQEILAMADAAGPNDLVFCLLSGGASALMPGLPRGILLEDKQQTLQALLRCGAPIQHINTVRKHISTIKGGWLAKRIHPARLVTLALSDVVGDSLEVIGSGPTTPDTTTYGLCLDIITAHDIRDQIPHAVLAHLEKGAHGKIPETPKPLAPVFTGSCAQVVGNAAMALEAAQKASLSLGYHTLLFSAFMEGEARDVAKTHTDLAAEIAAGLHPLKRPACVLSGGETTVTVRGKGLGGRNMEFVLAAARQIAGMNRVAVLSCGTDGTDGPTQAAGAVANGQTISRAHTLGLDAATYLADNNSYNFFLALDDLVITGPTLTNVMDIRVILLG